MQVCASEHNHHTRSLSLSVSRPICSTEEANFTDTSINWPVHLLLRPAPLGYSLHLSDDVITGRHAEWQLSQPVSPSVCEWLTDPVTPSFYFTLPYMCDLLPLKMPRAPENFLGLSVELDIFIFPRELCKWSTVVMKACERKECCHMFVPVSCLLPPVGQAENNLDKKCLKMKYNGIHFEHCWKY